MPVKQKLPVAVQICDVLIGDVASEI